MVAIAIHAVKVSISSSRRGLFSAECFLLKEQSLFELRTKIDFCIQISMMMELKIKISKRVADSLDSRGSGERPFTQLTRGLCFL